MGTPVSSGNRGVLALGASIVDLLEDAVPGAEISYLLVSRPVDGVSVKTRQGPRSVPVVSCRMAPRPPFRDHLACVLAASLMYRMVPFKGVRRMICAGSPWVAAVAGADFVGDVRGGDSFSDIYGLKRFVLAFFPVLSVLLIKGRIVHFPQTYGPFRTGIARRLAGFLLKRSSVLVARDRESQRIAQALVGRDPVVELSPDVAFRLHSEVPDGLLTEPPLDGKPAGGMIGLNVNGLMFNGGYTGGNMFGLKLDYRAFLPALMTRLLKDPAVEILLIPHTLAGKGDPESDDEASREVRQMLPAELRGRVRTVVGDYDAHQLKGVIRQCDFFLGSRMHSCIAALSQGVPCVGVAYSMKFAGVFESVGMEDWVLDGRVMDCDEMVAEVLMRYEARDSVRGDLGERSELARRCLGEVFRKITREACGADLPERDEVAGMAARP